MRVSLNHTYQECCRSYEQKDENVKRLEAELAQLNENLTEARRLRRRAKKNMEKAERALNTPSAFNTIDLLDSEDEQETRAMKDDVPDRAPSNTVVHHNDEDAHGVTDDTRQAVVGVDLDEEETGRVVHAEDRMVTTANSLEEVEETANGCVEEGRTKNCHGNEEGLSVAPALLGVDRNVGLANTELSDDESEESWKEEDEDSVGSVYEDSQDAADDNEEDTRDSPQLILRSNMPHWRLGRSVGRTRMELNNARDRPELILRSNMPHQQLRRSVGRTRDELNKLPRIDHYMSDCKFGQGVVSRKGGKVYAITLNDQWNVLAKDINSVQEWYVGVGATRRNNALLVAGTPYPIPMFHAPKTKQERGKIYYVGHYSVIAMHELARGHDLMNKKRQLLVRMSFTHFDVTFDNIIARRGP